MLELIHRIIILSSVSVMNAACPRPAAVGPLSVPSDHMLLSPPDPGVRRRDGASSGPAGGRDAEPGGGEEPCDRGGVRQSRERDEGGPREPGGSDAVSCLVFVSRGLLGVS